jgi:S1-C subfamily serine protease
VAVASSDGIREILQLASNQVIRDCLSGVAQVLLESASDLITAGSAFLVDGGIVTNSHVIRAGNPDIFEFCFQDNDEFCRIRLSASDVEDLIRYESPADEWDVAFLGLDEPELEGRHRFQLEPNFPKIGQQIGFIGYPFKMRNQTAHIGHVSSLFKDNEVSIIQIDGSINGGNSGGPLIELDTGKVLGIVTRAHTGFVTEQFDALIHALNPNVQVLSSQQNLISIGGINPIQALASSQAAMLEIAKSLRQSANVGIGFAFSAEHLNEKISKL